MFYYYTLHCNKQVRYIAHLSTTFKRAVLVCILVNTCIYRYTFTGSQKRINEFDEILYVKFFGTEKSISRVSFLENVVLGKEIKQLNCLLLYRNSHKITLQQMALSANTKLKNVLFDVANQENKKQSYAFSINTLTLKCLKDL